MKKLKIHQNIKKKKKNCVIAGQYYRYALFKSHLKKKIRVLLFQDFPQKSNLLESVAFQHENYYLANFLLVLSMR